jgi:hypothetical protein
MFRTRPVPALAPQVDTVGIPGGPQGVLYTVTPDGVPPAESDLADLLAGVNESLAAAAGIGSESGNQFWILGAQAGSSTPNACGQGLGHVLAGGFRYAGPFRSFSVPQDLSGGFVRFDVRASSAAVPTSFRFLLVDETDKERWTPPFDLSDSFQTFTAGIDEFTVVSNQNDVGFEVTAVTFVGLDICANGNVPDVEFHVDNAVVSAPGLAAPASAPGPLPILVALLLLAGVL